MSKNSYYVTKTKKKKEVALLELEKLDGYKITPHIHNDDMIKVSKVIFLNDDMTERIIRKKVDRKINYFLEYLNNDSDDGGIEGVKQSLMMVEKLRVQLINNYVKYLGNTYYGLTLRKIELIISELRYKLYLHEFKKQEVYIDNDEVQKKSGRGR